MRLLITAWSKLSRVIRTSQFGLKTGVVEKMNILALQDVAEYGDTAMKSNGVTRMQSFNLVSHNETLCLWHIVRKK